MNQSNNLNLNIDSRIAWFGCVKRIKSLNKSPSYVVRAETIHCFIDHHGPTGADPDRCNRCKCIGQSHMIDNQEVCAQDFLSDANRFNIPNAPFSLLPLLLRSNLVTSDSGTKAMADN